MDFKPLYHLVSLGCAKNRVDSENIMGLLQAEGYGYSPEPSEAQVIIINTCSFISPARKESVEEILQMAEYKKGKCRVLLVAGCMPAHYGRQLFREIPQVDGLVNPANLHRMPRLIEDCLAGRKVASLGEGASPPGGELPRQVTGSSHSVYLKIADGCNHHCAFCIIPRLRGAYRSRPLEALLNEAEELVSAGARELNLVAQDTTFYGRDLYGEKKLPELLHRLAAIPRLEWIRVLYAHPLHVDTGLLKIMGEEEKVCSYLDLPLQHAAGEVLKNMGRGASDPGALLRMCRERVPGLVLRSTFIVGFPGERPGHFQRLLEFLREHRIERVGVFPYSREEGTPAAGYSRQVRERVKKARHHRTMLLLRELSREGNRELVGRELTVMVDGPGPRGFWQGRYFGQAPEVDGSVSFASKSPLNPGDLVKVRITRGLDYDLEGEVCR